MMKQWITVLLLLCLALCGCGKAEPTPTPEITPTEAVKASPRAEPKKKSEPIPTPSAIPTFAPTPIPTPEPADDALVYIRDYIPSIFVDLRYATGNNFTGQVIYDFTEPQLRYGTVKKLAAAEAALRERGLGLLIWDACRPVSAQFRLWEVCPDSTFVANPNTGVSNHCRGNTVDLTLVTADGKSVEMPSDFDAFSALADRDYSDVSETAAENARLLEQVMTDAGFVGYSAEWWHYTDRVWYDAVG